MKKHKKHNSFAKTLVRAFFDEVHQARLKGKMFWVITMDLFRDVICARTLSLHYRAECAARGVEAILYVR